MDKNTTQNRLDALDGLRGIAILLVFFTHIDFYYILSALPSAIRPLGDVFIGSGRTGVSLFFLLSGFLMATYYPVVENKTAFLQKRYTRIFPLFISLVVTRTILRANPSISLLTSVLALFVPAFIIYFLWVHIIKRINSKRLSLILFYGFVSLQVLMALIYALWIMRNPPIYFNQLLPPAIKESLITLANVTLTLPFGKYIPQLDGVYWSLIAEVLFYILYPVLFVPLTKILSERPLFFRLLFILSVIPLLLGLTNLSYRILGYAILDIPYFFFFVIGIGIANFYRSHHSFFANINWNFQRSFLYVIPVLFLVIIFPLIYFSFKFFDSYKPLIRILSALPFAVVFSLAISKRTSLNRVLESRFLIFVGTVSYSMYLVQTSVIDTLKKIYSPTSLVSNILFVFVTFTVLCLVSYVIHYLLERPFFVRNGEVRRDEITAQSENKHTNPNFLIVCVTSIYFFAVFSAYQSNFNFFSQEHKHTKKVVTRMKLDRNRKTIPMNKYPKVSLEIRATENNLGILTTNLTYVRVETKESYNENQLLTFRIKEKGARMWYSESSFVVVEIGNSDQHPFGFPPIANSKGKIYEIEIALSNPRLPEKMNINISESVVTSVYQVNKFETIRNPTKLFALALNKFLNVIENPSAQYTLLLFFPFLILLILLIW